MTALKIGAFAVADLLNTVHPTYPHGLVSYAANSGRRQGAALRLGAWAFGVYGG
jgi:hypothetical protein